MREVGRGQPMAQDWPTVIDRYEKLQALGAPLKESEVKRLRYARKLLDRRRAPGR